MNEEETRGREMVLVGLVFEGGLGLLAWLLGYALRQPPLATFRWSAGDAGFGVLAALPMLVCFFAMVRWPLGPLRRIKELSEEFLRSLFRSCSVADLAGIAILAGTGEEMLFRGFLQAYLSKHLGLWLGEAAALWLAVGLANLFFALVHLITPTYAFLAGLVGVYFSLIWLWNGNLLVVIVAHAVYDFIALVYLVRGPGRPACATPTEGCD